ncbi:hypothetical protein [Sphingomonas sp. ID0503]
MSVLKGQTVFVTGGSRDTGRSIVTAFLNRGARVFTVASNIQP